MDVRQKKLVQLNAIMDQQEKCLDEIHKVMEEQKKFKPFTYEWLEKWAELQRLQLQVNKTQAEFEEAGKRSTTC